MVQEDFDLAPGSRVAGVEGGAWRGVNFFFENCAIFIK